MSSKWTSVLAMQEKLSSPHLSPYDELIYDRAIGYALEREVSSNYFQHNCYRHGKTAATRFSEKHACCDALENDVLLASDVEIETSLDQNSLIKLLLLEAKNTSEQVYCCVLNWVQGFSVQESAKLMGLSNDTVKKIRQRFKSKCKYLGESYGY